MRKTINSALLAIISLVSTVCVGDVCSVGGFNPKVVRTFPQGAITRFSFDEGVGTNVMDLSGRNLTGTMTGTGTTVVSGHNGGSALSFNSSSLGSVSLTKSNLTNKMSVSAWVKLGTTTASTRHAVSMHPGWFLSNNIAQSTFRFAVKTATEVSQDFGTLASMGLSWHHCVGVYDGTMMYAYMDGLLTNSGTQSGNVAMTGSMRIGNYWNASSSLSTWSGCIDDVVIYDRALTVDEVRRLYFLGF